MRRARRSARALGVAIALAACGRGAPSKGDECVAAAKLVNETQHAITEAHATPEAMEAAVARAAALTVHDPDVARVVAEYRDLLRDSARAQRGTTEMYEQALRGDTTAADRMVHAATKAMIGSELIIPHLKDACRDAFSAE